MGLRETINDSVKEAMKAKDAKRLGTLRLINAAIKDRDIAARTADSRDLLGDDELLGLLAKMIKQREDSITAYDAGNRPELAQNERDEIAIIRDRLNLYRSPFRSAEVFEIEDVIDPRDTRPILCRWANLVASSRRPGTMAWTFRP